MALPKKGLRHISVKEIDYHWKFTGKVVVERADVKEQLLVIDFGWYDVWDFVNKRENRPPEFEPSVVTPKFVREAILFALENGWDHTKLVLRYNNGQFAKA